MPACRHCAERIEAETDLRILRRNAAFFHQIGEAVSGVFCLRAGIAFDGDAGVEMDAVKRLFHRSGGKPVTMRAGRAGEDEG